MNKADVILNGYIKARVRDGREDTFGISVKDYGAIADYDIVNKTGTNNTTAFQNALNAAYILGCKVIVPAGMYLLLGDIVIPKGVHLEGENWNHNTVYRDSDDFKITGTCLVLRGMSFTVDTASQASDLVIYYDQQNYTVDVDLGQPDGLEAFVEYDPTFECLSGYSSAIRIERILYIGGSTVLSAPNGNMETMRLDEIYGCCTKLAFKFKQSADTSRITNIHFNPNFLSRPNWCGDYYENFVTKLSYNFDLFSVKGVDELNFSNITTYACRNVFTCESGAQSGFSVQNCSFDRIHRFILQDNNTNSFGIKISNSTIIPMVDKTISGGVLIDEVAELIKPTSNVTGGTISFSNCNVHTDVLNSDNIINLTDCASVHVLISNTVFLSYNGKLYTSGSVLNTVTFKNCYRVGTTPSRLDTGSEWNVLSTVVFGANSTYQGASSGNASDAIDIDNITNMLFVAYRANGAQKYRCYSTQFPVKMSSGDDVICVSIFDNSSGSLIGLVDINLNKTAKTIRYRYVEVTATTYNYDDFKLDVFYN